MKEKDTPYLRSVSRPVVKTSWKGGRDSEPCDKLRRFYLAQKTAVGLKTHRSPVSTSQNWPKCANRLLRVQCEAWLFLQSAALRASSDRRTRSSFSILVASMYIQLVIVHLLVLLGGYGLPSQWGALDEKKGHPVWNQMTFLHAYGVSWRARAEEDGPTASAALAPSRADSPPELGPPLYVHSAAWTMRLLQKSLYHRLQGLSSAEAAVSGVDTQRAAGGEAHDRIEDQRPAACASPPDLSRLGFRTFMSKYGRNPC